MTRSLALGSIVVLAICSALLAIGTLASFQNSSVGDLAVTSTPGGLVGLVILLAVTLAWACRQLVHAMRRRQMHLRIAPTAGAQAIPMDPP